MQWKCQQEFLDMCTYLESVHCHWEDENAASYAKSTVWPSVLRCMMASQALSRCLFIKSWFFKAAERENEFPKAALFFVQCLYSSVPNNASLTPNWWAVIAHLLSGRKDRSWLKYSRSWMWTSLGPMRMIGPRNDILVLVPRISCDSTIFLVQFWQPRPKSSMMYRVPPKFIQSWSSTNGWPGEAR